MKIKETLSLLFLLLPFLSISQDPKHENHYQDLDPVETDAYKVSFSDQHAQKDFVFIKLQIENKTKDHLMFKPHEVSFSVPEEGRHHPDEDVIFIPPKETHSEKIKVSGDANFHKEEQKMKLAGLYQVSKDGEVQEGEPFKLPAEKNTFEIGDGSFECSLAGDVKQETKETKADFECTYHGDGVGLVNHRKVSVKTEDDEEFANKKKKGLIGKVAGKDAEKKLLDGESSKVKTQFEIPAKVVDMQFADLYVHWNDCFRESQPDELESKVLELALDPDKTDKNN